MTDLDKIQEQLDRLNVKYEVKRFSIGRELRVYNLDGEWLGSLYFDLEGEWQHQQTEEKKTKPCYPSTADGREGGADGNGKFYRLTFRCKRCIILV